MLFSSDLKNTIKQTKPYCTSIFYIIYTNYCKKHRRRQRNDVIIAIQRRIRRESLVLWALGLAGQVDNQPLPQVGNSHGISTHPRVDHQQPQLSML